jgi:hypothetical protein
MARSYLTATPESLVDDSGTVLFSLIKGEQLEFPIVINFLEDATQGYEFLALVVEAENELRQSAPPDNIQPSGVQTELDVRLPDFVGTWNSAVGYSTDEVVVYSSNGKYYRLISGNNRIDATPPPTDPLWEETSLNTVYIRFPATLGADWEIKPRVGYATYGFFELSVKEPNTVLWPRTWKPVRGMVQLLFSPTLSTHLP